MYALFYSYPIIHTYRHLIHKYPALTLQHPTTVHRRNTKHPLLLVLSKTKGDKRLESPLGLDHVQKTRAEVENKMLSTFVLPHFWPPWGRCEQAGRNGAAFHCCDGQCVSDRSAGSITSPVQPLSPSQQRKCNHLASRLWNHGVHLIFWSSERLFFWKACYFKILSVHTVLPLFFFTNPG